jgi:hypothetical protein
MSGCVLFVSQSLWTGCVPGPPGECASDADCDNSDACDGVEDVVTGLGIVQQLVVVTAPN